jgi:hypothetical protein
MALRIKQCDTLKPTRHLSAWQKDKAIQVIDLLQEGCSAKQK